MHQLLRCLTENNDYLNKLWNVRKWGYIQMESQSELLLLSFLLFKVTLPVPSTSVSLIPRWLPSINEEINHQINHQKLTQRVFYPFLFLEKMQYKSSLVSQHTKQNCDFRVL